MSVKGLKGREVAALTFRGVAHGRRCFCAVALCGQCVCVCVCVRLCECGVRVCVQVRLVRLCKSSSGSAYKSERASVREQVSAYAEGR